MEKSKENQPEEKSTVSTVSVKETPKPKKNKKGAPKWLEILEQQSWQAELLISGLMVASLFQLPDFFITWVEGYIIESSELGFMFLSIASMMVLAGIDSLILFFGFHFLLRGIWVAQLGLNSVYPAGINVESTNGAGPKYWQKAKEKYPSLSAYNLELDQQCSLIFSLATMTIIMMSSISVIILLLYQLFRLMISMFPFMTDYVLHIAGGIYLIFMVLSIAMNLVAKKFPDNKKVENFVNKFGEMTGVLFSLYIFRKPIGYILSILTSNVQSKAMFAVIMVFSFFLGITGGKQTSSNPIYRNFGSEDYITFNNLPSRIFAFNYENLREEGSLIFTPTISSDIVTDKMLKVFIPTIEREKEQMKLSDLSLWEKIKATNTERDSIREVDLKRYMDFNQIFVNDTECLNADFQYYTHSNAGEPGIMVYISTNDFLEGKNILEIKKQYFSKDGTQKLVKIPFFFKSSD